MCPLRGLVRRTSAAIDKGAPLTRASRPPSQHFSLFRTYSRRNIDRVGYHPGRHGLRLNTTCPANPAGSTRSQNGYEDRYDEPANEESAAQRVHRRLNQDGRRRCMFAESSAESPVKSTTFGLFPNVWRQGLAIEEVGQFSSRFERDLEFRPKNQCMCSTRAPRFQIFSVGRQPGPSSSGTPSASLNR